MNRRYVIIFVFVIVANIVMVDGFHHRRAQKQEQFARELRDAQRYAGAMGPTITAFDERTNRWIAEMKEESIEVTLQKLTDAAEYLWVGRYMGPYDHATEEWREKTYYSGDVENILCNRRFRKAFEDIQKTDRNKAAELLKKNIRENLAELRVLLQENKERYSRGEYADSPSSVIGVPDDNSYRQTYYHIDRPPSHFARRYAVLSYLLLASHFELREVRPAVEEVIQLAKEELEFFNSMDVVLDKELETSVKGFLFKGTVLRQSLYRPSLLLTATLCDPKWNTEKRKQLEAKLVPRKIVDWEARALEHDHDAVTGLLPVVPHEKMLEIRYYQGITEAEFNDFFGK